MLVELSEVKERAGTIEQRLVAFGRYL